MKVNPHRSSLGMDANTLALLCYIVAFVLSWIPVIKWVAWAAPLVIFFIEKESPFVKFHAMQAFLLEAVLWVFQIIFSIIIAATAAAAYYGGIYTGRIYGGIFAGGIFAVILGLISIAFFVFAIIALVKAGQYYEYKIPLVGNWAMKISRKNGGPM